jgi:hypothetical protein
MYRVEELAEALNLTRDAVRRTIMPRVGVKIAGYWYVPQDTVDRMISGVPLETIQADIEASRAG